MEPINQLEQQPPLSPQSNDFRKRIILTIGTVLALVIVVGLIYWIKQKPPVFPISDSIWSQFGFDPQSSGQAPYRGPQTNRSKWVYKLGSTNCHYQTQVTAPVLDKDGNLYFGTSEGSFISLDPKMNKRWEYKLLDAYARNTCPENNGYDNGIVGGIADYNISSDPVFINSGLVVFGTSGIKNSKKIYTLDLTGQLKWMYTVNGPLESAIKLGLNGQIYFATPTTLYILDVASKNAKTYPLVTKGNTPAIGKDGTVYACSADGLVALTSELKLKWIFSQVKNLRYCSPAIDPKSGVIYFTYKNGATNEYKLYALNNDGSLKWKTDIYWSESAPAVASDGTIYVSTTDLSVDTKNHNYQTRGSGEIIALNPDGSKKWSYNVKPILRCKKGQEADCLNIDVWQSATAIDASPTIANDGTIYFGSDGKRYFALNPDGTEKWIFDGGDEWDNRAVISNDETLYVGPEGAFQGGLYAFSDSGTSHLPPDDEPKQNNSSEPGGR